MVTRELLESMYWPLATTHDWTLIELFGINPHAPFVRVDGQGLVTILALSKLIGGRLEAIAGDHATIRYRSGSLLTWRRGAAGLDAAMLWWEFPAVIGSQYDEAG